MYVGLVGLPDDPPSQAPGGRWTSSGRRAGGRSACCCCVKSGEVVGDEPVRVRVNFAGGVGDLET